MSRSPRPCPLPVAQSRSLSVRPRTALAAATLAAAGCGLVLPTAGVAQGPGPGPGATIGPSTELVLTGPTIEGFKLGGSFLTGGIPINVDNVNLTRRSQGATETHTRRFSDGGEGEPNELPTLKLNSSLSKGTLKAPVRGIDRLSLTFTATEKAKRIAMPENFGGRPGVAFLSNCTGGDGRSRKGVLKGTLSLSMGSYFDTIKLKKLKATVIDLPARSCDPPPDSRSRPELGFIANGDRSTYSVRRLGSGKFSHVLSAKEGVISRSIVAEGDGSSFSYSDDAATATVTGVGPLLSGTLNYTASQFVQNYSAGRTSGAITGKFVTGNLRASGINGAQLTVPGSQPR